MECWICLYPAERGVHDLCIWLMWLGVDIERADGTTATHAAICGLCRVAGG